MQRSLRPSEAAAIGRFLNVPTGRFLFASRAQTVAKTHEEGWRAWLAHHFPVATSAPFAARHVRLWEWFAALEPGKKPPAQVECWPRGGAKSSTAELGVTFAGVSGRRRFALYVSGTQGQANKHVQAIGGRFDTVGSGRATNRYGNSLGWRMDLLRVAGGFSVLALGLDAAGRGVKIDDFRPDLIILDDIDDRHDTEKTIEKKITTLTESILPMGAGDAAVLVVQNKIHAASIVTQLTDGKADFLNRRVVHEEPAVRDLEIAGELRPDGTRRYRITKGSATWPGQSLEVCEAQLNEWGRSAFLREAQHDMNEVEGGLWDRRRDIDPFRISPTSPYVVLRRRPELLRIAVAIDPNTDGKGTGNEAGIVVAGSARFGTLLHAVILEDATVPGGPLQWAQAAVDAYHRWQANDLVAESNNGGEMVRITIKTIRNAPAVQLITASRGKQTRAEPVQKLAEEGRVHHDGVFVALERELCTWQPGDPSPNRLDAMVWAVTKLALNPEPEARQVPVRWG